jgi:hypothetical protein
MAADDCQSVRGEGLWPVCYGTAYFTTALPGDPEIYTSLHLGPARPKVFYDQLGFIPTGNYYGDEPEVVLKISVID